MVCKKCGYKFGNARKKCPACGEFVEKSIKMPIGMYIGAVVSVIVIIAYVAFAFSGGLCFKKSSRQDESKNAESATRQEEITEERGQTLNHDGFVFDKKFHDKETNFSAENEKTVPSTQSRYNQYAESRRNDEYHYNNEPDKTTQKYSVSTTENGMKTTTAHTTTKTEEITTVVKSETTTKKRTPVNSKR